MRKDLASLATEAPNPDLPDLAQLSTLEMIKVINGEDAGVAGVVAQALPEIASAIEAIAERISQGGRLVYMGAGTSGRLGSLDASEWTPTFSVPKGTVVALVAGGARAWYDPVEGAEDLPQLGEQDLQNIVLSSIDCLVGITASGRTPYVLGGMQYAQQLGTLTIFRYYDYYNALGITRGCLGGFDRAAALMVPDGSWRKRLRQLPGFGPR